MSNTITYIFRKRLPHNNSIEELFYSIEAEVTKNNQTNMVEVEYFGASPLVLLKNLLKFKNSKSSVNHITGDIHYMALCTGKHTILTIHDVKSATKGHFLKQFYIRLFWFWCPALLVKRITVISEFTKCELLKIIPFAKHKVSVVFNPVNSVFKATQYTFKDEIPNILFVGTKSNKNLELSFEALKEIPCHLTIIGPLSTIHLKMLKEFEIDFDNKINIDFEEIVTCYKQCDLLCFASTYEGFGMPIIEAQAVGRPVVTSNLGAMREVAGDSACLVNPFDVNSIRDGILRICNDIAYREELINRGFENVKRFQLENISQKYLAVYREVLN